MLTFIVFALAVPGFSHAQCYPRRGVPIVRYYPPRGYYRPCPPRVWVRVVPPPPPPVVLVRPRICMPPSVYYYRRPQPDYRLQQPDEYPEDARDPAPIPDNYQDSNRNEYERRYQESREFDRNYRQQAPASGASYQSSDPYQRARVVN